MWDCFYYVIEPCFISTNDLLLYKSHTVNTSIYNVLICKLINCCRIKIQSVKFLMLPIVLYRIPNRPKRFGYVAKKCWLLPRLANIAGLNFTIRHYTIRALCAILRLFHLSIG